MGADESVFEQSLADSHAVILAFRGGDESAMGRLAESLRPYLKHVVRQELGIGRQSIKDDDSDLVQQTLIKAVQGIKDFRGNSLDELRAWLAAIARNESRASVRRHSAKRRSLVREVRMESWQHPVSREDSPSTAARHGELGQRLQTALNSLNPDQRQIIRWRQEEGLSHAEIADRLQIKVDTARQRCKAAMDALRDIWSITDSDQSAGDEPPAPQRC